MRSLLLALTFSLAAGPLAGQRLAKPLPRWEPSLQFAQSLDTAPKTPVPDYRWAGMAVGGAFVGILGAALGSGFCGNNDSAARTNCTWAGIKGFAMGALVGGVIGGMVGSGIRKGPPDDPGHP